MNQKQRSALLILLAFCIVSFAAGFGTGVAYSNNSLTADDLAKVEVKLDEQTGIMMLDLKPAEPRSWKW